MHASTIAPRGLDVHACALRTLCEVARTPDHDDGLLGHLANAVLLLPQSHPTAVAEEESDYVEAQRRGQEAKKQGSGGCSVYHQDCPLSLFQVGHAER